MIWKAVLKMSLDLMPSLCQILYYELALQIYKQCPLLSYLLPLPTFSVRKIPEELSEKVTKMAAQFFLSYPVNTLKEQTDRVPSPLNMLSKVSRWTQDELIKRPIWLGPYPCTQQHSTR